MLIPISKMVTISSCSTETKFGIFQGRHFSDKINSHKFLMQIFAISKTSKNVLVIVILPKELQPTSLTTAGKMLIFLDSTYPRLCPRIFASAPTFQRVPPYSPLSESIFSPNKRQSRFFSGDGHTLTRALVAAAAAAFCSWSSSEVRGSQHVESWWGMVSVTSCRRVCCEWSIDCICQLGTNSCWRPPPYDTIMPFILNQQALSARPQTNRQRQMDTCQEWICEIWWSNFNDFPR